MLPSYRTMIKHYEDPFRQPKHDKICISKREKVFFGGSFAELLVNVGDDQKTNAKGTLDHRDRGFRVQPIPRNCPSLHTPK